MCFSASLSIPHTQDRAQCSVEVVDDKSTVTSPSRNVTEEESLALVSKCQNESAGRLEREKKKREPTQIRGPSADPPCEYQFSPLNYEHVKICQNIFL